MNEQILEILAAHPDGLTSAQIFDIAKQRRLNRIPDAVALSNAIWVLREKKLAVEIVGGEGRGRLYALTAEGRGLLGDDDVGAVTEAEACNPDVPIYAPEGKLELGNEPGRGNDPETIVNDPAALVDLFSKQVNELLNNKTITTTVRFKAKKLALLDKFLEICMGSYAEGLLAGIKADLNARPDAD